MFPAEPPAASSGFQALLKNKPFVIMWLGQIVSQVADKVFFILLIALLDDYQTQWIGENSMRSAIMVAFTIPAILFGSAAGIFVDRMPKKKVMVVSDILRAVLTLLIPLLPNQFVILLVLTFFISTVTQVFAPAEQAVIPLLVKREHLMTANAMFTTTMMVSLIVGFIVGEPLLSLAYGWGGKHGPEYFVAILYGIAAIFSQSVVLKEKITVSEDVKLRPWDDFKAGLHYLWKNRLVRNAMVQLTILYSIFAALTVLAIQLAAEVGLKPEQFGFLLGAAGVGMVFGAGILGHWGEQFHHRPLPLIGFVLMGFVLGVFTLIDDRWVGYVLSACLGFGASLIGVPMQTLIHQQTSETMRGKVFGFQNNAVNIALSAPLAIAGPLTDAFGLRIVLLSMSFIVLISGVWAWRSTRPVLEDVL